MMNYGVDFVHEKAVEWVELIKIKEDNLCSFRIHTDFVFHECLLYATLARSNAWFKKHEERIDDGTSMCHIWSMSCPDIILNKFLSLEAKIDAC